MFKQKKWINNSKNNKAINITSNHKTTFTNPTIKLQVGEQYIKQDIRTSYI